MRDLPHGFGIYLVNNKTMRKIAQIFVAFSEKLNFTFSVVKETALFAQKQITKLLLLDRNSCFFRPQDYIQALKIFFDFM